MPGNAGTTKTLSVCANDFICSRENVLWLLGFEAFYDECPAFGLLRDQVKKLRQFLLDKGLIAKHRGNKAKCARCDALIAAKAQATIMRNFAKIFIHLHDQDRMDELKTLRNFVSKRKNKAFARVILAYPGRRRSGDERVVIVD